MLRLGHEHRLHVLIEVGSRRFPLHPVPRILVILGKLGIFGAVHDDLWLTPLTTIQVILGIFGDVEVI